METIVFLDRATVGPTVELNRPSFAHDWVVHDKTKPKEVAGRLEKATIAITNKAPIRKEQLDAAPHLKMIAVAATGYDVIDVPACRERGVAVANIRRYATSTVPEHTFALMLALRRSIVPYRQSVMDGAWIRSEQFCYFDHPIGDLAGSTLGVIGEGALGQATAKIGEAFGMTPLFAAHKGVDGLGPLYTPFDEVLARSDVISLHAPLTPRTRNVLSTPEFEKMKRKPLIINTARGGLVDEEALVDALDRGLIAGAGFDVTTTEPAPRDNPLMKIADRPNVILTPHVAWASENAMQGLWNQLVENVEMFHAGTPRHLVT